MRGFKAQRKQRKQSKAQQTEAQQPQAEAQQQKPAVPEKRTNAITEYAGGYETARRLKAVGLKDGGEVRGPGTATSDDIEAVVPEGSYIMPADSSESIGHDVLVGLGAPVPVNLSNGEHQLPPEQVHAIGVQVLEQIKDATHTPTEDAHSRPEMFFADGGEVRRRHLLGGHSNAGPANPSTPRLGAPRAQGALPPPQAQPAPQSAAPQARPALLAPQGPAAGPVPSPGPAAGFREPDWRGRAMQTHRVKRDTADFQAERAAQDARFSEAERARRAADARQSTPGRARTTLNQLGKGGALLAAAPAIASSAEEDSTARYARRFGVSEPTGDGSLGDIAKFTALRAGGFATDLGSSMTFGLADRLYQDRQEVDTETMARSAGAVTGAVAGDRLSALAGRGIDGAARVATRGRYKGNYGERAANSWAGRRGAPLVGATMGAGVGASLVGDEHSEQAEGRGPVVRTGEALPQVGPTGLDNDVIRVGNSFSASGPIREGFTVNGQDPGLAPGTIRNLDDGGAPAQPQAQSQSDPVPAGGFRAGGPQAILIRDNAVAERERQNALRHATARQRGAKGITRAQMDAQGELVNGPRRDATELQREAVSQEGQDRRAESRNAIDWMRAQGEQQALGFQSRAAERVERLHQQYEQARTPQERSQVAQAIRELQGQARPPHQVATTEDLIDPSNPMAGTRRIAYVIDPVTGQGRPVSGGQEQGRQFEEGQIYTDANGNLARWNGQQFVPVE